MSKFELLLRDFKNSLNELEEVLKQEKDEFIRDSTIKRFELAFELTWKTLKAFLDFRHNAKCASPQSCFQEAFKQGFMDYDDLWIEIARWRNEAVHTYNEELAESLYSKIPTALSKFREIEKKIDQSTV